MLIEIRHSRPETVVGYKCNDIESALNWHLRSYGTVGKSEEFSTEHSPVSVTACRSDELSCLVSMHSRKGKGRVSLCRVFDSLPNGPIYQMRRHAIGGSFYEFCDGVEHD